MAHGKLAILRRRLFTILSVLSLLLCLAVLALWVRSYFRYDGVFYAPNFDRRWAIRSLRGHLDFSSYFQPSQGDSGFPLGWSRETGHSKVHVTLQEDSQRRPPSPRLRSAWFGGFGFFFIDNSPLRFRFIGIPHWFLALLFAILPALKLRAILRSRKRLRKGLCPVCGYDLRATPDRCPECGTAAARA